MFSSWLYRGSTVAQLLHYPVRAFRNTCGSFFNIRHSVSNGIAISESDATVVRKWGRQKGLSEDVKYVYPASNETKANRPLGAAFDRLAYSRVKSLFSHPRFPPPHADENCSPSMNLEGRNGCRSNAGVRPRITSLSESAMGGPSLNPCPLPPKKA